MRSGCVFCKIARGQIPSHRVHEDELTLAFMDVNQVDPGHVIVVLRPHLETIVDLSPDQAAAVFRNGQPGCPGGRGSVQARGPHDLARQWRRRRADPADELAWLATQIRVA